MESEGVRQPEEDGGEEAEKEASMQAIPISAYRELMLEKVAEEKLERPDLLTKYYQYRQARKESRPFQIGAGALTGGVIGRTIGRAMGARHGGIKGALIGGALGAGAGALTSTMARKRRQAISSM